MVLEFLNELKLKVSAEDYKIIFSMTIDDIRFNRTSFGIKTSPGEFIEICKRCCIALNRCNGGVRA
jgi:hypothetical protein